MAKTIHQRAMLVSLKLSKWSATKFDKKISAEVARQHNADEDAGRYTKKLLDKKGSSYGLLMSAFTELYEAHISMTLPWGDEGWRMLPMANHGKYTAMVRDGRAKIETLLEDFIVDYPGLRDERKRTTNGLFNPADWPEPMELRKRFSVKVHYNPVPATQDFRIELDSETIAEIARETEERVNRAVQDAQADYIGRINKCVSHMAERLHEKAANPSARLYDSVVENARDLAEALTNLNVTNDPRLEEIRQRVEQLAQVSPEALKTLPFQCKATAAEADKLLADMQAMFGEVVHA